MIFLMIYTKQVGTEQYKAQAGVGLVDLQGKLELELRLGLSLAKIYKKEWRVRSTFCLSLPQFSISLYFSLIGWMSQGFEMEL